MRKKPFLIVAAVLLAAFPTCLVLGTANPGGFKFNEENLPNEPVKLANSQSSAYTNITVSEAKTMTDSSMSLTVLDVRNPDEYSAGHIRNANLIPVDQLASRLNELEESSNILVYCRLGVRSTRASQTLADNNFTNIYNMLGGITAWIASGFPVYTQYASIQQAVNDAYENQTLYVSSGTYFEHLLLNKSLTLTGEDRSKTIIDANQEGTAVKITANETVITDFTIQNSSLGEHGLLIENSSSVRIEGNTIINNGNGITLDHSWNTSISDNVISANQGYGVRLDHSPNSVLKNNSLESNRYGFSVEGQLLDDFIQNVDASNKINGKPIYYLVNNAFEEIPSYASYVAVVNSSNVEVQCADLADNGEGILIAYSRNILFANSTVRSNNEGICIVSCSNVAISRSLVTQNTCGILLSNSNDNVISGNTIADNNVGVQVNSTQETQIHHNNLLDNLKQVILLDNDSSVFWDDSIEGNYWSDGVQSDLNYDGISDTSYEVGEDNTDNFPLLGRFQCYDLLNNCDLTIISNSTVEDCSYFGSNNTIIIHVTNETSAQTSGFCRIRLSHALMDVAQVAVSIDDGLTEVLHFDDTLLDNGADRWIYFAYEHSKHEIIIVPEFELKLILIVFFLISVTAIFQKTKVDSMDCAS